MSIQQNTQRILTTHVGSLPRPKDLLDLMKAKIAGVGYDKDAYEMRVRTAVRDCVRKQVETGIDILTDGEQSKPGFFTYVRERLEGFQPRPHERMRGWPLEVAAFPGGSLTDDFQPATYTFSGGTYHISNASQWFMVGPTLELALPKRLSVEVDAVRRRIRSRLLIVYPQPLEPLTGDDNIAGSFH